MASYEHVCQASLLSGQLRQFVRNAYGSSCIECTMAKSRVLWPSYKSKGKLEVQTHIKRLQASNVHKSFETLDEFGGLKCAIEPASLIFWFHSMSKRSTPFVRPVRRSVPCDRACQLSHTLDIPPHTKVPCSGLQSLSQGCQGWSFRYVSETITPTFVLSTVRRTLTIAWIDSWISVR